MFIQNLLSDLGRPEVIDCRYATRLGDRRDILGRIDIDNLNAQFLFELVEQRAVITGNVDYEVGRQ